ncbi:MAG: hypothetical protein ACI9Y7_001143 [Dokdonia sp.]|jgi:hypothetical protein
MKKGISVFASVVAMLSFISCNETSEKVVAETPVVIETMERAPVKSIHDC